LHLHHPLDERVTLPVLAHFSFYCYGSGQSIIGYCKWTRYPKASLTLSSPHQSLIHPLGIFNHFETYLMHSQIIRFSDERSTFSMTGKETVRRLYSITFNKLLNLLLLLMPLEDVNLWPWVLRSNLLNTSAGQSMSSQNRLV